MHVKMLAGCAFVAAVVAGAAASAGSQTTSNDAKIIASAMAAAPKPIAEHATIVAMNKDGSLRTVRKGTNGVTCMPDDPAVPGPSSMCLDANAMTWAGAWMAHKRPPNNVGFIYMLAGGTDASNTDPFATAPAKGQRWIKTGPHVMVTGPATAKMAGYPGGANPDTTKPYTMWAGTPYAHLMIPVR